MAKKARFKVAPAVAPRQELSTQGISAVTTRLTHPNLESNMLPKSSISHGFESWFNRAVLSGFADSAPPQKLAAGVLLFMIQRRALSKEFGFDFLEHLEEMTHVEFYKIYNIFRGSYIDAKNTENVLRRRHGDVYIRAFPALAMDPLATRIGASIGVQLMSGHIRPSSQVAILTLLNRVINLAKPHLPEAFAYVDTHYEPMQTLLPDIPPKREDGFDLVSEEDFATPLKPAPQWVKVVVDAARR